MRNYVSSAEFKSTKTSPGTGVRKEFVATPVAMDDRTIRFTVSTADIDRSGDIIDQSGWLLDDYVRNSVVLFGHDHGCLPIGRCIDIGIEGNALKATVEFVGADMPEIGPKADAVYRMLKSGFLSAVSVGFLPLDYSMSKDEDRGFGMDFKKQVLLEFSVVTVPDQPQALIEPGQRDSIVVVEPSDEVVEPSSSNKQLNTAERLIRERLLRKHDLNSRII